MHVFLSLLRLLQHLSFSWILLQSFDLFGGTCTTDLLISMSLPLLCSVRTSRFDSMADAAEPEQLAEHNRTLSEENAQLRQLIQAQTEQRLALLQQQQQQQASSAGGSAPEGAAASSEGGSASSVGELTAPQLEELLLCRQQLKVANAMAERQYEELLELRRRCAVYSNAIQEGKQAMQDMKALYAKLAELTSSVAVQRSQGS